MEQTYWQTPASPLPSLVRMFVTALIPCQITEGEGCRGWILIPLTAGFIGKFYMFATALSQGHTWLVLIAVLSAVIGIWYYFKVIIAMYMKDADDAQVAISFGSSSKMVLWIATLASLVLGVLPGLNPAA